MLGHKNCLYFTDIGHVDSPLPSGGNLTREKDLQVIGAEKDLVRIFESSSSGDDDDDAGVGILAIAAKEKCNNFRICRHV